VKNFTSIIHEIPKSVQEAYERILNKSIDPKVAKILLKMIVGAARPLKLREMDIVLAVATQKEASSVEDLDVDGEKLKSRIRNLCGLFVYIADSRVHLFHQTAKEFLLRRDVQVDRLSNVWRHSLEERNCEYIMAETCMRYLLLDGLETCKDDRESDLEAFDAASDFGASDAASDLEAREAARNLEASDAAGDFGASDAASELEASDAASAFEASDIASDFGTHAGDFMADSPSDWSEQFQMADLGSTDLETSDAAIDCETLTGDFVAYSAIHWPEHFRKVDVGSTDQLFGFSLTISNPKSGHHDVWLRKYWQSTHTFRSVRKMSSLSLAAFMGHTEVVRYLLDDEKSDVDSRTSDTITAFGLAADRGNVAVVQLLTDKRTFLVQDTDRIDAVFLDALANNHEKLQQLLIDRGFKQAVFDPWGFSLLETAACWGHEKAVEQLLY
jgi:Ankyrin repeats (many copies)